MAIDLSILYSLLAATGIGYVLGSFPIAALVSRWRGVDIFSTGTRLAGAANVARNVGRRHGVVVFLGDAAKGALAVQAANSLGVEGAYVFLPAAATLAGHWRSLFTGFRGGDGLSTLVGVSLALLPLATLVSAVPGLIVLFIARSTGHHPTLWGGTVGYAFMLLAGPVAGEDMTVVLGVIMLALMVLAHGVMSHRGHGAASA